MSRVQAASGDGMLAAAVVATVRAGEAIRRGIRVATAYVASTVTALGWFVLVAVVAGFWVGYALGWEEFIAVGWAGLILVLVAVLFLIGRNAFRIRLSLPVNRTVAGERVPAQVTVENPGRARITGLGVEVPVGDEIAEFHISGVARGSAADEVFLVAAEHRGVIGIGPVRTVRADPVGLFRRELTWAERTELYVHPRTTPVRSLSTGYLRDLEGVPTRDLTSSDISFHALREYAPGDERRLIHWKSSAKTGTYLVRQFEQTRRSHILIVLGAAAAEYADDDEFELAVSAAASLGTSAIREARSIGVWVSGKPAALELSTSSRNRLLDELTVVEHGDGHASLVDAVRLAARDASSASVAFLVTGAGTTIGMLRQAAAALPPGVEVVAVVCEPGVLPTMRRVAELSVVTVGYLDDLQKTLARAAALS